MRTQVKCPQPPGNPRNSLASAHATVATEPVASRIPAPTTPRRETAMSSTDPLTGPRRSSHEK
jgi:hypothetical protein